MGRVGVEFLNLIVTGKKAYPVKMMLQAKLVERKSCAKIIQ
jgi:hypothetical protein